jgi:lysophospholipase L1-like esterase
MIGKSPNDILFVGDSQIGAIKLAISASKKTPETDAETAAKIAKTKWEGETIAYDFQNGTPISFWNGQRFTKSLDSHPNAGTVVISLGTNDSWKSEAPDTNLILDEIQKRNIKCIWIGGSLTKGRNEIVHQEIKKNVSKVCTYISIDDIELIDGTHPTVTGAKKILQRVWFAKK